MGLKSGNVTLFYLRGTKLLQQKHSSLGRQAEPQAVKIEVRYEAGAVAPPRRVRPSLWNSEVSVSLPVSCWKERLAAQLAHDGNANVSYADSKQGGERKEEPSKA